MSSPPNYRVAVNSGVRIHPFGLRRPDRELSRWTAEPHSLLDVAHQPSARPVQWIGGSGE